MEKYTPKGCGLEQISRLEVRHQLKLPTAYKEYLFLAGIQHHFYCSGVGYCYDEIDELQNAAVLLLEGEGYKIDQDYWVIDLLYNDQFSFFYLNDGENPAIYHWVGSDENLFEGFTNGIIKMSPYLSKYIEDMIPSKLEKLIDFIYNIRSK